MAKQHHYPEHDKLRVVHTQSQTCGDFLEWLREEKGWQLAERHQHTEACYELVAGKDRPLGFLLRGEARTTKHRTAVCGLGNDELCSANYSLEKLLAEYFGIDLRRLEDEKRHMLDVQCTLNAKERRR